MATLGKGYQVWVANARAATILLVDDLPAIIEHTVTDFSMPSEDNIKLYLDPNYVNLIQRAPVAL